MALRPLAVLSRFLYGLAFAGGVPLALVWWARATARVVPLPAPRSVPLGAALLALGVALIVAGTHALVAHGRGLPMNAFPPPRLVREGIYRYLGNPMYVGFGLCCVGGAIAVGSASGLWLVAPVAALGAGALVLGYERHDLGRRFGVAALGRPRVALPRGGAGAPTAAERVAVYAWVLLPAMLAAAAIGLFGRPGPAPRDAFGTLSRLPVAVAADALVLTTPLLARTAAELRAFAVSGGLGTGLVVLAWLAGPGIIPGPPSPLPGLPFVGMGGVPALQATWLLAAASGAPPAGVRTPVVGWIWRALAGVLATAVAVGTPGVGVLVAAVLFAAAHQRGPAWRAVRDAAEEVANSWWEWRLGPVRVIGHAVWAGAAGAVGLLVAAASAGPGLLGPFALVAVSGLVTSALWGQAVERSSGLLRPFGWYGGLLGAAAAMLLLGLLGAPVVLLAGALSVAAPWAQAIGRLRCLVQGCCHGGPAPDWLGIRYRHRCSRVSTLPDLAGVPVHPTPLYSIAANVVTGLLLTRLWARGASPGLVLGLFLVLNGLARFVEEAYRAEPQTPVVAGLRLYQWLAALSVAAGIVATTVESGPPAMPFTAPDTATVAAAAALGLVVAAALSMDFPRSSRRFSRLGPPGPARG